MHEYDLFTLPLYAGYVNEAVNVLIPYIETYDAKRMFYSMCYEVTKLFHFT